MAFAITRVEAYGIEVEEPLNKRYKQWLNLTITAANTDTDWDLGDYVAGSLGTFWDAVDGTDIGAKALDTIRTIVTNARVYAGTEGDLELTHYRGGSASGVVYTEAGNSAGIAPNFTFASGSAPTSVTISLTWFLKPQGVPTAYYQEA